MTPIIWSIAGTDSGGGAGLAADQRAADALGVHCCTVVAGITAQSTTEVTHIEATPPAVLQAQLDTLVADMPPCAIKTGLLGSADNVRVLARFVDRLREQGPLALVVDPVLRASTGAALASAELLSAYRDWLLPRATVITPNQSEAVALLDSAAPEGIPAQARALRALGCGAVIITGGDAALLQHHDSLSLDWLDTPQAQGWLSLPRETTPHNHGTGCTFASALAAALALGWVVADAAVLAKMAATFALRHARAVGQGIGPVVARPGFATEPSLLPQLSVDEQAPTHWYTRPHGRAPGVYAIVDSAERVEAVLRAASTADTVDTVQLRMKRPEGLDDAAWHRALGEAIARSQRAANVAGVLLVINDHWQAALAAGARALHLGQDDLMALTPLDRARLDAARAQGVQLGISSHSLWELCRAAGQQPDLIACGPVWPTTTKDMPWKPQGLDNLAWWAHMAPAPVVGIGGILAPEQLRDVAASGAAGGCVVRGLGPAPAHTLPAWQHAWRDGSASRQPGVVPMLPHPTLLA
jgi:hydroxymethylpyrimidine kinase/phosphomethylpyrimidine kinase/thiamine-phosphate diphosphorylase